MGPYFVAAAITNIIIYTPWKYVTFCMIMDIAVCGAFAVGISAVRRTHDTRQPQTCPHATTNTALTVTDVTTVPWATLPSSGGAII